METFGIRWRWSFKSALEEEGVRLAAMQTGFLLSHSILIEHTLCRDRPGDAEMRERQAHPEVFLVWVAKSGGSGSEAEF